MAHTLLAQSRRVEHVGFVAQVRGGSREDALAVAQHHGPVGDLQRRRNVLLDEHSATKAATELEGIGA